MHSAYLTVLFACTAGVLMLIGWRLVAMRRHGRPSRGRVINEWIWTLIPLAVLAALVWSALRQ
jgi:heme/copper-type cytochrome/quinol oxidase subunit 2